MDKRTVLIADDELYIRQLMSSVLGKDYIVLETIDGEEAVDIARNQKPDIILMDIMMPKLDGIGACYILKSDIHTRAVPISLFFRNLHSLRPKEFMRNVAISPTGGAR